MIMLVLIIFSGTIIIEKKGDQTVNTLCWSCKIIIMKVNQKLLKFCTAQPNFIAKH